MIMMISVFLAMVVSNESVGEEDDLSCMLILVAVDNRQSDLWMTAQSYH